MAPQNIKIFSAFFYYIFQIQIKNIFNGFNSIHHICLFSIVFIQFHSRMAWMQLDTKIHFETYQISIFRKHGSSDFFSSVFYYIFRSKIRIIFYWIQQYRLHLFVFNYFNSFLFKDGFDAIGYKIKDAHQLSGSMVPQNIKVTYLRQ